MKYARIAILAWGIMSISVISQAEGNSLLKQFENEFVKLGENIGPSVVEISATGMVDASGGGPSDDLFRFFGTPQRPDAPEQQRESSSTGSGFIINSDKMSRTTPTKRGISPTK